MKRNGCLVVMSALAILFSGCPKKPSVAPAEKKDKTALPPGALPQDEAFASGTVQGAVMEMETRLDVVGLIPEGATTEELKKAQEQSVTKQIWSVSDERGRLVFDTEDFIVPRGTQIRYHPGQKKYVLFLPQQKKYWAMTGGEIGNLLEGGPSTERRDYTITIQDTEEKETIAGVEATRTNAELGFRWQVKTKAGQREGKVKVKLAIWHSADAKLKPAWGQMMVDFLTVPFQDDQGQKVISELKGKIRFPVKWSMEVENAAQHRPQGEVPPKLVTIAQKLDVQELGKSELATPPTGASPATGPYEFGEGGQLVKDELLGMIPAKQGPPPKDAPPENK